MPKGEQQKDDNNRKRAMRKEKSVSEKGKRKNDIKKIEKYLICS
jgi:hypothetical protein